MVVRRKLEVLMWLFLVVAGAVIAVPRKLYVDDSITSSGVGTSWGACFKTLQEAITEANAGDEIIVGQGTYSPGSTRSSTFEIAGLTVRGGYAGYNATDPNARDIETYITTLSGDIDEDDSGNWQDMDDNNYMIVSCTSSSTTELDGFTIDGGYSDDYYYYGYGGGLYCSTSLSYGLTVRNCTFTNNYAYSGGGAMYCDDSSTGGTLNIYDCTFERNQSLYCGGAMYISDPCNINIKNCDFLSNYCYNSGGGAVYVITDSYPHFEECLFDGNWTYGSGGAIWLVHGNSGASIKNSKFFNNSAYDAGGAIYQLADSSGSSWLAIYDSAFVNNSSNYGNGGGIFCDGPTSGNPSCYLSTYNSTFTDNDTYYGDGGGVCGGDSYYSRVVITHTNSLLWSNTDSGANTLNAQIGPDHSYNTTYTYCCVEGGSTSNGNICPDDPRIDVDGYHLISDSDCIGEGDPSGSYSNREDIDGEDRLGGTYVDIGCDEFSTRVYNDGPSDKEGTGYYSIQTAIDDASTGDTIIAEVGTYHENIDFDGKDIILSSTDPDDWNVVEATIIEGNGVVSVVTFDGSEPNTCEITGFTITDGGNGGIVGVGCLAVVSNCIIENNDKAGPGAGIHNIDGDISNCIIRSNSGYSGGGLAGCDGTISNCLIVDNYGLYVGGLNNCDGDEIINCTIANNTIHASSGTVGALSGCDIDLTNCVVWGNDTPVYWTETGEGKGGTYSYSCLEGSGGSGVGWDLSPIVDGGNNIAVDPDFVDDTQGDYRLEFGSPCMDTGTDGGVDIDIDGIGRPFNNLKAETSDYDMGAYESLAFRFTGTVDQRPTNSGVSDTDRPRWRNVLGEITNRVGDEGIFHISPGDVDHVVDTYNDLKHVYVPGGDEWGFGANVIWFPVVGNHEAEDSVEMDYLRDDQTTGNWGYYQNLMDLDSSGPHLVRESDIPAGTEGTTYSFDYGDSHFIVLNQYWDGYSNDCGATKGNVVDNLYKWLIEDLYANDKTYVFVMAHEPAYPQYRHFADSCFNVRLENRDRFWKVLNDRKVVAYLTGHTHYYYHKQIDNDASSNYTWDEFTWQIDLGNAGNESNVSGDWTGDDPNYPNGDLQTFLDVTVGEDEVTFGAWRGTNDNNDFVKEFNWTKQVTNDLTAPTIDSVSTPSTTEIEVVFSEWVDETSAEDTDNYVIGDGSVITVSDAELRHDYLNPDKDYRTVVLTVSQLTASVTYTLKIDGVKDHSNNLNAASNLQTEFEYAFVPIEIEVRISAGDDDVEEKSNESMDLDSSDIELVYDGGNQTVGLIFRDVQIPADATISNAYIQFTCDDDDTNSETCSLTIKSEVVASPLDFNTQAGNVSSRLENDGSVASVSWSPPNWTSEDEMGSAQRTPNLSTIIQEIVDLAGWSSGNNMVIIITGTGERTAEVFEDSPGAAPLLHIEY